MRRAAIACAALAAALVGAAGALSVERGRIDTIALSDHPRGLAVQPDGSVLVAEPYANVVNRIAPDGTVSTVAGDGRAAFGGDGGPATTAQLDFVHGVAFMPDGGFVLADTLNERIRRVFPDGSIDTVAGIGIKGYSGDGHSATTAAIADPRGVATFPDGRILIPDTDNDRIRLVALDGTIQTVAGNGVRGFSGDGGPAVDAELSGPFGVAPLPDGGFLVDDSGNERIRRVWPDGHITTVAGNGVAGYAGDGGPATSAELNHVHNVIAVPGGFVIADTGNDRVRLVRSGRIQTVAGSGVPGFTGDGGPAIAAELDQPKAVAITTDGSLLIGDALNNRIRRVEGILRPPLSVRLATRSLRARRGKPIRIRYTLGAAARVRVRVLRQARVAAAVAVTGKTGQNLVVLRKPLRPGRYRIELVATAPGETARAAGVLTVTR